MVYVYQLYTYIFHDYDDGRIYSEKELSIEELMHLITRAIKIIGEWNAENASDVCKKCNELLGSTPSRRNIDELIDVHYNFANDYNCGGYFRKRKINDWLGDSYHYKSKRFFTWYEPTDLEFARRYVPCRFGLYVFRDEPLDESELMKKEHSVYMLAMEAGMSTKQALEFASAYIQREVGGVE